MRRRDCRGETWGKEREKGMAGTRRRPEGNINQEL